jgi:hypothetical protein
MNGRFRAAALVLTSLLSGALSGAAFGADALSMEIDPAFEGYTPSYGTLPVAVLLRNTGADARGVVRVSGENFQMDYPIELPRGTRKRLLTYPSVDYSGLRYMLLTDRGTVLKSFAPNAPTSDASQTVLLIDDASGVLSFLRGAKTGRIPRGDYSSSDSQGSVQDAYTTPDNAPTRAVAYANLSAIVLGTGSERLSTEAVDALKLFTLSGGTLVFVGGASSAVLGDPRWKEVLPVHDLHVSTIEHSRVLQTLGEGTPPPVSVTSGTPVSGAEIRKDGSTLMTAERGFGIGKVVFLAFNPLEPPLSKWDGRRNTMSKTMRLIDSIRTTNFLNQFHPNPNEYPTMPGGAVMISSPTGYHSMSGISSGLPSASSDPFSTKLPPTERVFLLLGAYFVVVVPLNFLVLRKLKRGELAWVTAPIISLGFASAFFASAQGLYSAKMSTASQGILLAQQGLDEGLFVGQSQLFIPRSGTYDLKVQGLDSLGVMPASQMYYYGGNNDQSSADLNPVDVGEIKIPEMQASNLAFKRVEYRQKVPIGKWFSISVNRTSANKGTCTIRNDSAYELGSATLYAGDAQYHLDKIAAGQSKTVPYDATYVADQGVSPSSDFTQFLARNREFAVVGLLNGYRPGPQLGTQVDSRTSVKLAFVGREALGPK